LTFSFSEPPNYEFDLQSQEVAPGVDDRCGLVQLILSAYGPIPLRWKRLHGIADLTGSEANRMQYPHIYRRRRVYTPRN